MSNNNNIRAFRLDISGIYTSATDNDLCIHVRVIVCCTICLRVDIVLKHSLRVTVRWSFFVIKLTSENRKFIILLYFVLNVNKTRSITFRTRACDRLRRSRFRGKTWTVRSHDIRHFYTIRNLKFRNPILQSQTGAFFELRSVSFSDS